MALVGISKAETFVHVSDSDPAKTQQVVPVDPNDPAKGTKSVEVILEGATEFTLGTLDVFLMASIYDRSSSITRDDAEGLSGLQTKINATAIDAVRYGLKGWKNFQDAQGNDKPLTFVQRSVLGKQYQAVDDECLTFMGIRLIQELGGKIKEASNVTKAEAKNSATAS
jgi:hypothetical protein